MELIGQTYLSEILHAVAQVLLAPVVVLLLLFIAYSVFAVGSLIAETVVENRQFAVSMPDFLARLSAADAEDVPDCVTVAGLLNRQKVALLTLWDYRCLPAEAHTALAKRLLSNENLRYQRISGSTDAAAKLAPMLGLMGTLIPLGPGIAQMGQGDLNALSQSLIIAFDTTVAGLLTAFVCFIVSKVRRNRYKGYMVALESGMTTLLEKVAALRGAGALDAAEPTDFARQYAQATGTRPTRDAQAARAIAERVAGEGGGAADAGSNEGARRGAAGLERSSEQGR